MSNDQPADGDLVISRCTDDGRFQISVTPGEPQMKVSYKNQAVDHAFAYADRNGATVWFCDASGHITRVDRPRRKES
jgi:hypothetical protein